MRTLGAGDAPAGAEEEVGLEHHIMDQLALREEEGGHLMVGGSMVN